MQGKRDGGKLAVAQDLCSQLGITMDEVAYIGDDINCIDLLTAAGCKACPADASAKVKAIPNIKVITKKGGKGCVRDFAEMLL